MLLRTLVAILVFPLSSACATEQRTPLFPDSGTTPTEGTAPTGTPDDEPSDPDNGTGAASPTDASTPPPIDVVSVIDGSAAPTDVVAPTDAMAPGDGSTAPDTIAQDGSTAPTPNPAQVAGSARPTWQLVDFQPVSPRTGQTYGLEAFDGTVTVVALHSSWCGYCRSQAEKMEQLYYELDAAGTRVQMVSINSLDESAVANQANLTGVCTFPIFQDTAEAQVWASIGGTKDDFYIYRADGTLALYINHRSTPYNLSVEADYNRFRDLLIEIAAGRQ